MSDNASWMKSLLQAILIYCKAARVSGLGIRANRNNVAETDSNITALSWSAVHYIRLKN
jgi:hypothetical protein